MSPGFTGLLKKTFQSQYVTLIIKQKLTRLFHYIQNVRKEQVPLFI